MRSICFWLMMVLMPLRAWAGDAMALQMALMGQAPDRAAVAVASSGPMTGCHEHLAVEVPSEEHGEMNAHSHSSPHDSSHDHNCLHCDICQGKVHAVLVFAGSTEPAERELPAYGSNPMEPGPAAAFFKPPIS